MKINLEELITTIVKNLDVEKLDKRVESYTDYKNPYVVLKPSVKVEVELTNGKIIKIDVTDYFEEVIG